MNMLRDRGLVIQEVKEDTIIVNIGSSSRYQEQARFIGRLIRPFIAGTWVSGRGEL